MQCTWHAWQAARSGMRLLLVTCQIQRCPLTVNTDKVAPLQVFPHHPAAPVVHKAADACAASIVAVHRGSVQHIPFNGCELGLAVGCSCCAADCPFVGKPSELRAGCEEAGLTQHGGEHSWKLSEAATSSNAVYTVPGVLMQLQKWALTVKNINKGGAPTESQTVPSTTQEHEQSSRCADTSLLACSALHAAKQVTDLQPS